MFDITKQKTLKIIIMQSQAPSVERVASELVNINSMFDEQGKRLLDVFNRIASVGNRLSDETGCIENSEKKGAEGKPQLPGIVSDLNNKVDGFRELITRLENQVYKLEKFI